MIDRGEIVARQRRWERFVLDRRRSIAQAWLGGIAYPGFVVLLALVGTVIVLRVSEVPVRIGIEPTLQIATPLGALVTVFLLRRRHRHRATFRSYDAALLLTASLAQGVSFPAALRRSAREMTSARGRAALGEAAYRCEAGIPPAIALTHTDWPGPLRRCVANATNRDDLVRRLTAEIDRFTDRERHRISRLAAVLRPAGVLLGGTVLLILVARVYLPALEALTTIPMEGL